MAFSQNDRSANQRASDRHDAARRSYSDYSLHQRMTTGREPTLQDWIRERDSHR